MNTKKSIFFVITFFMCLGSYAQIGVTAYSIYAMGVNTSTDKLISGELKTFANRDLEYVLMEADVYYNFNPREHHRFSLGLGTVTQPFGGDDLFLCLTLPAQLEVFPLQDFRRLSLIFDVRFEWYGAEEQALRSLFGIRYALGLKSH